MTCWCVSLRGNYNAAYGRCPIELNNVIGNQNGELKWG